MSGAQDKDRRTLPPTPKRVKEFRQRGEIARSRDLGSVATLLGGAVCGMAFAPMAGENLLGLFRASLSGLDGSPAPDSGQVAGVFVACAAPAAIGAFVAYLVNGAIQLGWPPALVKPKVDPSRVFSAQAIAQAVSPKAMAGRVFKSSAKILFVALAAWLAVDAEIERFLAEPALDPGILGQRLMAAIARIGAYAGSALFALALVDFVWQKRQMAAKMRMTPEEYKREHREQEGDPQLAGKRKKRMRELAQRRLGPAVKSADVVIVNPTHFAVALKYNAKGRSAPKVVAKGKDAAARRIRDIARFAGVPILSRPPLARLLYKVVPEGREIPEALYHAVAEVLAYVYRLRRRGTR